MAIFAVLVFIGFALSCYFRSWEVFNHLLGYGLIFASIPLGLKFASVAGLNPIAVFFYLYSCVLDCLFLYLSKEALMHRPSHESIRNYSIDFCNLAQYPALTCIDSVSYTHLTLPTKA